MARRSDEEGGQMSFPYKCTRCRNHGIFISYRSHKCPFSACDCRECRYTTKRRQLKSFEAKLKRREDKVNRFFNLKRRRAEARLKLAATNGEAGPSSQFGEALMAPSTSNNSQDIQAAPGAAREQNLTWPQMLLLGSPIAGHLRQIAPQLSPVYFYPTNVLNPAVSGQADADKNEPGTGGALGRAQFFRLFLVHVQPSSAPASQQPAPTPGDADPQA
ncbi:uncharacterized protein ACB058_000674 isoform 2-T4 [Synchiropus picturatus]